MPPILSSFATKATIAATSCILSRASHPSCLLRHRAVSISSRTSRHPGQAPRRPPFKPTTELVIGTATRQPQRLASSTSTTVHPPASASASSYRADEDDQRTNDHSSSSSSSSSTASSSSPWSIWSLFAPFQRAFQWYLAQLNARPYTVQMLTSAFLFAIGDITAQHYEAHLDAQKLLLASQHLSPEHADPPIHPLHHQTLPLESHAAPAAFSYHRLAACTLFGLLVMGPAGHWWYSRLDGWVLRWAAPRTMRFVGYKVLLDTVIFNPLFLVIFFTSVSLMEGLTFSDIRHKLYRDFVPSYAVDCSVWPIVQCFNFRFVTVNLQLLVVNLFCYFDDVFISYVQHNGMPAFFVGIENAWLDYIGEKRKSGGGDSPVKGGGTDNEVGAVLRE